MPDNIIVNKKSTEETIQQQEEKEKQIRVEETIETSSPTDSQTDTQVVSQINVTSITNQDVPIVVFFGPPASGKSMILVRLSKYLRRNGEYIVTPDTNFLPTEEYRRMCDDFKLSLATNTPLPGTVRYLLIDVKQGGRTIMKLLEAPGEHFFSPTKFFKREKQVPVYNYLNSIMNSKNPKRFVVLTDLHVGETEVGTPFSSRQDLREAYESRFLEDFRPKLLDGRDRIILLYNKIDLSDFANASSVNIEDAKDYAKQNYPRLFGMTRPSLVFFKVENFQFATFCTGTYSPDDDNNNIIYEHGDDRYPKDLWELIK